MFFLTWHFLEVFTTAYFATSPPKGTFLIFIDTKNKPRYEISACESNSFYEVVELINPF